jgi:hypothetical protein
MAAKKITTLIIKNILMAFLIRNPSFALNEDFSVKVQRYGLSARYIFNVLIIN